MNKEQVREYLVSIVIPLVLHPEAVQCDLTTDDMGVLYTLTLGEGDFGRVVGRQGQTIKAIRTVIQAVGMANKIRTHIKVTDPEDRLGQQATAPSSTLDELGLGDLKV